MSEQILPDLATFLDSEELDDPALAPTEIGSEDEPLSYGLTPAFNFGSEDPGFEFFPGSSALVSFDDQRSLLTWVSKAIRTPRGVYPIYGSTYGTELAANLGQAANLKELQLSGPEDIEQCVLLHPLITDVLDVSVGRALDRDSVYVVMTIVDRLGQSTEVEVVI